MYKDYRLIEYVEAVDSIQPAPGGGSVSGLVGALGTALVRMYGHLTTNKKKFQALDRDKQRAFLDHFEKLSALQNDLIENVDLDAQAYELVMSAYRMKNETEEEKKMRQSAISSATLKAIQPPMTIMVKGTEALRLCKQMVEDGNKGVISDLAIGVIYLASAIESSSFNVMINLSALSESEKAHFEGRMILLLEESERLKKEILEQIKKRMGE